MARLPPALPHSFPAASLPLLRPCDSHPTLAGPAWPSPSTISVDWNPACLQGSLLGLSRPSVVVSLEPGALSPEYTGLLHPDPPQPHPTVGFWKERQALVNNPEEKSVQINLMSPFPSLLPQEHRMG